MTFFSSLNPFVLGASDEALAVRGHFLGFLLAHRAAQQVGFAKRIARDDVRDLHHLFLVDDDAVGFRQDLLQLRQLVFDLLWRRASA